MITWLIYTDKTHNRLVQPVDNSGKYNSNDHHEQVSIWKQLFWKQIKMHNPCYQCHIQKI